MDKLTVHVAKDVFHAILPLLQIKRTKATWMMVNSDEVKVGPPYSASTVELKMSIMQGTIYQKIFLSYVRHLSFPTELDAAKSGEQP